MLPLFWWIKISITSIVSDVHSDTLPEGTQHFLNGFAVSTPVSTQLLQPALVLLRGAFDALGWRLVTCHPDEVHGHCSLVHLQGFYQDPQGWMRVSRETGEGVVPSLADVVGAFLVCYGDLVNIPQCGREQLRNATKAYEDTATEAWPSNSSRDAPNVCDIEICHKLVQSRNIWSVLTEVAHSTCLLSLP